MLITPQYLELQREMHARGNYGISSGKWAKPVSVLADQIGTRDVLDYGCGQGHLARALSVYTSLIVHEFDPAIEGKDKAPEPADLVVSSDVLEHIEPSCLEDVLDHIASLGKKAVFLVVATRPAVKILPDGRNAHIIVQPAWWWMQRFAERWRGANFAGNEGEFHFVGVPK